MPKDNDRTTLICNQYSIIVAAVTVILRPRLPVTASDNPAGCVDPDKRSDDAREPSLSPVITGCLYLDRRELSTPDYRRVGSLPRRG